MNNMLLWSIFRLIALILIAVLYPDPVAKAVSIFFILHVIWNLVTE